MRYFLKFLFVLVFSFLNIAFAHDGHGQITSSHWHSTDVFGFVAIALVLAFVYFKRGDK
jgi:ABC-type transport system involved in multi-copper enzyme maturation permease subunit